MNSDQEKLKLSNQALTAFFEQFGNLDTHANIVLETIFEALYGIDSVYLSGKAGQNWNQDINNDPIQQEIPSSKGK